MEDGKPVCMLSYDAYTAVYQEQIRDVITVEPASNDKASIQLPRRRSLSISKCYNRLEQVLFQLQFELLPKSTLVSEAKCRVLGTHEILSMT